MDHELQVEYVPISSIKPYKRNAKKHPKEQIDQIAESIRQMGFKDPIGIWHNEIVEGHGRYLAAKQLGIDTVPVIRLDDLTDEQRRAYALIHNQLTMSSGFDLDMLNFELGDIEMNMDVFGFSAGEETEPDLSELDADAEENDKTVARLVFASYKDYKKHENEIKDFADSIGAAVTVGK